MRLRSATTADLTLLRYWDRKPHVIAATGNDEPADWEAELPRRRDWQELLIAEARGRPVGLIQIIDPAREESHYWGDVEENFRAIDIWIGEESDLGRGYGSEMMRLALERCFADEAIKAVLVDPLASNRRAHRFYERLGFRRVERRVFGSDDCLVYRLERDAWRGMPPSAQTAAGQTACCPLRREGTGW
jgi:aminoglycoside 6'-N-acetyltransferase